MRFLLLLFISLSFCKNVLSQELFYVPNDFSTIQEAIDASSNGDTVIVLPGVYNEAVNFNSENLIVASNFLITGDTSFISTTIIDGTGLINQDIVTIENVENNASLIGVTIKNGNFTTWGRSGVLINNSNATLEFLIIRDINSDGQGPGFFITNNSTASISNCQIHNNTSASNGGGVYIDNYSNVFIEFSEIYNNQCSDNGGGIYIKNSTVIFDSCEIINNNTTQASATHGGGVSIWNSDVTIKHSLIRSNSSETGGGLYAYNSNTMLNYNDFSLNSTGYDGGGLTLSDSGDGESNSSIINCTFYDNFASEYSTSNEIKIAGNFYVIVLNSIIWGNIDGNISSIEYSNTQQVFSGNGNISVNPNFIDINPLSPNYNLNLGSPCINSGNPSNIYNDFDGTRNDMGAYPYNFVCSPIHVELNECNDATFLDTTFNESGDFTITSETTTSIYSQWAYTLDDLNYEGYAAVMNFDEYDGEWTIRNLMNQEDDGSSFGEPTRIDFIIEINECSFNPNFEEIDDNIEFIGSFSDNYYYKVGSMSWAEASAYCSQHGGNLLVVDNHEENQFISNYFTENEVNGQYWIGYKFSTESNMWEWVDYSIAIEYELEVNISQPETTYIFVDTCAASYFWNDSLYTHSGEYIDSIQEITNDLSIVFNGENSSYLYTESVANELDLSTTNNLYDIEDKITISAWIKPQLLTQTTQRVVSVSGNQDNDWQLYALGINGNGEIYFLSGLGLFEQDNEFIVSNNSVNLNQWNHIAITYDGYFVRLYLNGDEDFYKEVSENFPDTDYDLRLIIGKKINGGENFNGSIDDVSIWNRALSEEEINEYLICPPTSPIDNLVGFWDFNENYDSNVALDLSHGTDLSIYNSTRSEDVPDKLCILSTTNGCDSVVILNLSINESNTGVDVQEHCDTYTWIDGNTYTESNNTATFTLTNSNNCDSIVTLDLIINNSDNTSSSITACDEFTWDGQTYTESGVYTNTYTNANGCDSTHTLNLTINYATYGIDTQEHCDTYTWIDGNTYNESNNMATFTLTNSNNCDSIVTLDLIINNSDNTSSSITACDEFTWDGQTYSESGEYTNTYTNANGCDSTHTLNLNINSTTFGTDTQVHCDTYTWIDGETYFSSNNTATWTLTNSVGCDSVVTLDLSILNSTIGVDVQEHCDTYTWIDGNTYTASNNSATFTLTNAVACDSVVTLDLTINQSTNSYDTVIVCDSYDWNGTTYFESGSYVYTSANVNSCDSLANLDLTISQLELLSINGDQIAFTETDNNIYSISNPNASSTYSWSLSNNVGSIDGGNANNSEINITWGENDSETILCVFEEDEFGCQGEESCITIDVKRPSSIKDFEKDALLIFPNPFTNQTTVSFNNPTQSKADIKVIDSRGRIVRNYDGFTGERIIIKKEKLSEGLYYIQLKLNNNVTRKPIVIQ